MSTSSPARRTPRAADAETIADLLTRLGNIPARRVRLNPTPGTATEADLLATNEAKRGLCELVDGVLVEKPMGFEESEISAAIIEFLRRFVRLHNLGMVTAPDGPMRLAAGLVRLPDVAFISRDRLPAGKRPWPPVPSVAPDLAVEVLSKGNSKAEMARKLREYFDAGTRLVWLVDPKSRTVRVHTSVDRSTLRTIDESLDGGDVLPGFVLPLRDVFPAD